MMTQPRIGFIGAGKVGGTLAHLANEQGYRVTAIYSRTPALMLAHRVRASAVDDLQSVVEQSDLVFLTVPDDVIESVAQDLAAADWKGKGIVHTSGVHSVEALEVIRVNAGMVGSVHPAYPFSKVVNSVQGATFALEASHPLLKKWLSDFVTALGGETLYLYPGTKALYHAALVIVSNYTVTLYATAQRLLLGLGASQTGAANALNTLLGATVNNLKMQGIPNALTGPLVRNDVGTVQAHLTALKEVDPELTAVYRQLARLTYPVLKARGIDIEDIEQVLQQDENHHAINDP